MKNPAVLLTTVDYLASCKYPVSARNMICRYSWKLGNKNILHQGIAKFLWVTPEPIVLVDLKCALSKA
jgi:hypothetical protein